MICRLEPSWCARAFTSGSYSKCSYADGSVNGATAPEAQPTSASVPSVSNGASMTGDAQLSCSRRVAKYSRAVSKSPCSRLYDHTSLSNTSRARSAATTRLYMSASCKRQQMSLSATLAKLCSARNASTLSFVPCWLTYAHDVVSTCVGRSTTSTTNGRAHATNASSLATCTG